VAAIHIEILGRSDIDRLSVADSVSVRYVAAMVKYGPTTFVDNADVEINALVVQNKVLPLVVNRGVFGNSDVCSPYSHYVGYTLQELGKRHPHLPSGLLRWCGLSFASALGAASLEKAVFVNNWLLATNPRPALSSDEIRALTAALVARYPDSAIIFRTVNPNLDAVGFEALRQNRYRMVRSRRVYTLDANDKRYLEHRNAKEDLQLLRRTSYERLSNDSLAVHADRIAQLYRDLYLVKHSRLNPQFNANFVRLTLQRETLTYVALQQGGTLDAFIAYYIREPVLTGAILGYDLKRPRKTGLYRLLIAMFIEEASKRGLIVNLSAGAGGFKMLRGALPVEEFDAVYDHHLSPQRRAVWTALRLSAKFGAFINRPTAA